MDVKRQTEPKNDDASSDFETFFRTEHLRLQGALFLMTGSQEEAKELKGSRWLWQTNPENLTDEQRQQLGRLKERFPRLKQLVEQREGLRRIFEDTTIKDAAQGERELRG